MTADLVQAGRPRQRQRTRKDLLRAAARLMQQGQRPTLDDVAEEALVSRATAYRYFSGVDALLVEASLDVAFPEPADLFDDDSRLDALSRLLRADEAVQQMISANEPALRMMIAESMRRAIDRPPGDEGPLRQNRRTALIEAAIEPERASFAPSCRDRFVQALALVIGTEAMLVSKDVLDLSDEEAREMKAWAIEALVAAARSPAQASCSNPARASRSA